MWFECWMMDDGSGIVLIEIEIFALQEQKVCRKVICC